MYRVDAPTLGVDGISKIAFVRTDGKGANVVVAMPFSQTVDIEDDLFGCI